MCPNPLSPSLPLSDSIPRRPSGAAVYSQGQGAVGQPMDEELSGCAGADGENLLSLLGQVEKKGLNESQAVSGVWGESGSVPELSFSGEGSTVAASDSPRDYLFLCRGDDGDPAGEPECLRAGEGQSFLEKVAETAVAEGGYDGRGVFADGPGRDPVVSASRLPPAEKEQGHPQDLPATCAGGGWH